MSSEAWAQEDWSFGGLRRTIGAVGYLPVGLHSTEIPQPVIIYPVASGSAGERRV